MKNMKVQSKLLTGFGIVIVLLIAMAVFAIFQLKEVDTGYSQILAEPLDRVMLAAAGKSDVYDMRRAVVTMIAFTPDHDVAAINTYKQQFDAAYADIIDNAGKFVIAVNNDNIALTP